MVLRNIVQIDEELCNGCGQCIPNCREQALQLLDGKVKLVRDDYCDGLGACLGHCPQGAISIIKREAYPFDVEAIHAQRQILKSSSPQPASHVTVPTSTPPDVKSSLTHWPVQLNLVPVQASFLENSDLLILADCVPIAYPHLHSRLLKGMSVVIGCPKFDDAEDYVEKLRDIFKSNNVKSIMVAHMEVPCCTGLHWIVNRAVKASGKHIPLKRQVFSVRGEIM